MCRVQLTNNTIFITGGGSGIGRGLGEAFHAMGNQVIIGGRRRDVLDETTAANPGMASITMDVSDPGSIEAAAQQLVERFPKLNMLINNAGLARMEDLKTNFDPATAESMVVTNLLGPVRMTRITNLTEPN